MTNLPPLETRDDMRRFTLFVDVMYERKKVLVCETAGGASFEDAFGAAVESSEKEEEEEEEKEEDAGLTVLGEGGSSGRLTTMVGENLEWSATGRHGASLLDLVKNGDFSRTAFERCRSRLGEMMREEWLDKAEVGERDVMEVLKKTVIT